MTFVLVFGALVAKWDPGPKKLEKGSPETKNTVICSHRAEPYSNIIPHSSTRGSRVLSKMDSEQALDLYLQGTDTGQGGAEDPSNN